MMVSKSCAGLLMLLGLVLQSALGQQQPTSSSSVLGAETATMLQFQGRGLSRTHAQNAGHRSRGTAAAQLFDTAVKLLKNGATPAVLVFSEETLKSLNETIFPKIQEEHDLDQAQIEDLVKSMEKVVTHYENHTQTVTKAREKEAAESRAHKACRHTELSICNAALQCEQRRQELWDDYSEKHEYFKDLTEQHYCPQEADLLQQGIGDPLEAVALLQTGSLRANAGRLELKVWRTEGLSQKDCGWWCDESEPYVVAGLCGQEIQTHERSGDQERLAGGWTWKGQDFMDYGANCAMVGFRLMEADGWFRGDDDEWSLHGSGRLDFRKHAGDWWYHTIQVHGSGVLEVGLKWVPHKCLKTQHCHGRGDTSGVAELGCSCDCHHGFSGNACETVVMCDAGAHCSGNGSPTRSFLKDGCACSCNAGYKGADCSVKDQCSRHEHCSGRGSTSGFEIDGCSCTCDTGYGRGPNGGSDCSQKLVCNKDDCSNNGKPSGFKIDGCTCVCDDAYEGDKCETPKECSQEVHCSGNGHPSGNQEKGCTCACDDAWEGKDCAEKQSCTRSDCGGHGTASGNRIDGCTCACEDGWKGETCSSKQMCTKSDDCTGNGKADGNRVDGCTCTCEPGWHGDRCETTIPCSKADCSGNGNPSGPNQVDGCACICDDTWDGSACSTKSLCTRNNCNGHGAASGNEVDGCSCGCEGFWVGADCSAKQACTADDCSGNGSPSGDKVDGCSCACAEEYEGARCHIPKRCSASDHCSGNGHPAGNQAEGCYCSCEHGWEDADCSTKQGCTEEDDCGGHGTASGNRIDGCTCSCEDGWKGETCSSKRMCTKSEDCTGNGKADGNRVDGCSCTCDAGWQGGTCETATPCSKADCSGNGSPSGPSPNKIDGCGCICENGWEGEVCAEKEECKRGEHCSGHGKASGLELDGCVCECEAGWHGDDCSAKQVCEKEPDCSGNGVPSGNRVDGCTCDCEDEYDGDKCETPMECSEEVHCSDNGHPSGDQVNGCTCACDDGFEGEDCSAKQVCSDKGDCNEHGTASGNKIDGCKCACHEQWSGTMCDSKEACSSVEDCSSLGMPSGNRVDGCTCSCEDGWGGDSCDAPLPCESSCGAHGTVDGNKVDGCLCACAFGWGGSSCDAKQPCTREDHCNSHGSVTGFHVDGCSCECDDGWVGNTCLGPASLAQTQGAGECGGAGVRHQTCRSAANADKGCRYVYAAEIGECGVKKWGCYPTSGLPQDCKHDQEPENTEKLYEGEDEEKEVDESTGSHSEKASAKAVVEHVEDAEEEIDESTGSQSSSGASPEVEKHAAAKESSEEAEHMEASSSTSQEEADSQKEHSDLSEADYRELSNEVARQRSAYHAVVALGEERFTAWGAHAAKKQECDLLSASHEGNTTLCNQHQASLESASCFSKRLSDVTMEYLNSEWDLASDSFHNTKTSVEKKEVDRKNELVALSEVKCLLEKIHERGGQPCTDEEAQGAADEALQNCQGVSIAIEDLSIHWPDVPTKPSAMDVVPHPCSEQFVANEYRTLTGVCFASRPRCMEC